MLRHISSRAIPPIRATKVNLLGEFVPHPVRNVNLFPSPRHINAVIGMSTFFKHVCFPARKTASQAKKINTKVTNWQMGVPHTKIAIVFPAWTETKTGTRPTATQRSIAYKLSCLAVPIDFDFTEMTQRHGDQMMR